MNTATSCEKWPVVIKAYFGVKLTKDEADLWWDELKGEMDDITNDEICEAIRNASKCDRSKYAGKPTLKELRIWIFMLRKKNREENTLYSDKCNCSQGWILYIEQREDGSYHELMIPCLCKQGKHFRYTHNMPMTDRRVKAAFEQRAERKALMEKLASEIPKELMSDAEFCRKKREQILGGTPYFEI